MRMKLKTGGRESVISVVSMKQIAVALKPHALSYNVIFPAFTLLARTWWLLALPKVD